MQPGLGFVLQKPRFVLPRSGPGAVLSGPALFYAAYPPEPFPNVPHQFSHLRPFRPHCQFVPPQYHDFWYPAWGSPDDISQCIFNTYVEAGGNFIDTADVYAGGRSEELVGGYLADRGLRDQLVLATKFGFSGGPGNPNAGGNGRKNIHCAPEDSLRRLQTDYGDLYWLHV